jgi:putative ABC transport system substrate-binding protein
VPSVKRIAVLWHPGSIGEQTAQAMFERAEDAARTLGVQLQPVALRDAGDLERAFAAMSRGRAGALLVLPSPVLFSARRRIAELGAAHRLPSIGSARQYAELGCLLSYGASIAALWRRGASYVDRILKGAKPGELPIEQPTSFELVVNLKTARQLGLSMPQTMLLRADEVIE